MTLARDVRDWGSIPHLVTLEGNLTCMEVMVLVLYEQRHKQESFPIGWVLPACAESMCFYSHHMSEPVGALYSEATCLGGPCTLRSHVQRRGVSVC